MSVRIKRFTLGIAQTNAYLIGDTETAQAIVIDPVDDAQRIYQAAQNEGWTIALILATHGHFDHVLASRDLKALTGAPFRIHEADLPLLHALPMQGMHFFNTPFPEAAEPDSLLTDNEAIDVGNIHLTTAFTPGHAPGHMAFIMADHDIVFSGDALFAGSIGRTDLPGGDHDLLIASITHRLLTLPDTMRVLSGHGPETSIGHERTTNPWLQ